MYIDPFEGVVTRRLPASVGLSARMSGSARVREEPTPRFPSLPGK
jgi:hypothetical protein